MSPSLVGSQPIFGRIDVMNYAKTPSTLVVVPTMTFCNLVGLDGSFVPWENLSNMFKS